MAKGQNHPPITSQPSLPYIAGLFTSFLACYRLNFTVQYKQHDSFKTSRLIICSFCNMFSYVPVYNTKRQSFRRQKCRLFHAVFRTQLTREYWVIIEDQDLSPPFCLKASCLFFSGFLCLARVKLTDGRVWGGDGEGAKMYDDEKA